MAKTKKQSQQSQNVLPWLCPLDRLPIMGIDSYLDSETKLLYHVNCAKELGLFQFPIPKKEFQQTLRKHIKKNGYIVANRYGVVGDDYDTIVGIIKSNKSFFSSLFLRRAFIGTVNINYRQIEESNLDCWKVEVFGNQHYATIDNLLLPLAQQLHIHLDIELTKEQPSKEIYFEDREPGYRHYY